MLKSRERSYIRMGWARRAPTSPASMLMGQFKVSLTIELDPWGLRSTMHGGGIETRSRLALAAFTFFRFIRLLACRTLARGMAPH